MTNERVISVTIPARLLEQMPPAGGGRGSFIVQAIEEKITRRKAARRKPEPERGRRMAAALRQGRPERNPV